MTSERSAHGREEIKSCIYNEYGVLVGGFCLRAFIGQSIYFNPSFLIPVGRKSDLIKFYRS